MPPGITQPVIAMAFCPQAHAAGTYSPNSVGMKAFKNGTGVWNFTLDTAVPGSQMVVTATPVLAALAEIGGPSVSLNGLNPDGSIGGFTILTQQDGVAFDAGLMVTVGVMPFRR